MAQPCASREKALVTLSVLRRTQVPLAWGRAHMTLCILASSLRGHLGPAGDTVQSTVLGGEKTHCRVREGEEKWGRPWNPVVDAEEDLLCACGVHGPGAASGAHSTQG